MTTEEVVCRVVERGKIPSFELHIPRAAMKDIAIDDRWRIIGPYLAVVLHRTPRDLDLPELVQLETDKDGTSLLRIPYSEDTAVSVSCPSSDKMVIYVGPRSRPVCSCSLV